MVLVCKSIGSFPGSQVGRLLVSPEHIGLYASFLGGFKTKIAIPFRLVR